jgi:hypothetical protein
VPQPDDIPIEPNDFLTIRLAGAAGEGERFLLVGRPYDGLVHVREWTARTFNTAGEDLDIDAVDLLADIESVYAAGRGVTPEMYEIRLWLGA